MIKIAKKININDNANRTLAPSLQTYHKRKILGGDSPIKKVGVLIIPLRG